ncbi:phage integrase SAM-like domain-containing protein [Epilithonimonas sp.]|uniref:site-specific integrase n=1 Tax=Epilithonimonas sp. TaxID=2894511 RepID=UPI0028A80EC4|nr:phage integrase SAM-like domain-containing protein [Epilithonimonas sp.]
MAKVQFLIQGKSSNNQIYLRFSLGRKFDAKRKTGFVCDVKNWSNTTGFPKPVDPAHKNLKSSLQKLEVFVLEEYNQDFAKGAEINHEWLENKIDVFNGRVEPDQKEYLVAYGEYYIEQLPYGVSPKGKKGVSERSVKKYRTIVNKLIDFQLYKKKIFLLKDVGLSFSKDFVRFLIDTGATNDNTAGRYIKFVKTIILDARKNGYEVSPQIDSVKGFTVATPINPLSFEEINKIKNTEFSEDKYNLTRDWFIIGCYVGQRASDLFRMNTKMIQRMGDFDFIVITQEKTKKLVQIPIHYEVKNILNKYNGEFPPIFSKNIETNTTLFNRYIKKVCEQAGIDEVVEGNLFNKETKRGEKGVYPKWKLVSSHDCRRSFATNFYAKKEYPTPILMNITAHSSEKQFLEYIGQKSIDQSMQLAEIWSKQENDNKKEGKLVLLKTGSDNL